MFDWVFLQDSQSVFLVAFGAIIGSFTRFFLFNYFSTALRSKYLGTFLINITATFFLGFVFALYSNRLTYSANTSPIILLVCVGFLGSLSTFSTFIIELVNILLSSRWRLFINLALISLGAGMCAATAGLLLGGM